MQNIENNTPKIRSIRTLRQWIQQGHLPAGEELPPEYDLARLLHVSRTTLRAAIKTIEEEGLLRYKENRRRVVVGSPHRNGSVLSNTIAVLTNIPDRPDDHRKAKSPAGWERFIQIGLIDAIQEQGMHALTLKMDSSQKSVVKSLIADSPKGLVVMHPSMHPASTLELAETFRSNGIPVVFYGFTDLAKFDTVASDSEWGCYILAKWLIENGRRRILRVWGSPEHGGIPEWRRRRDIGYERAMAEYKLESIPAVDPPFMYAKDPHSEEHFQMSVRVMVGHLYEYLHSPTPVDAIMALTDGTSFALAAACRALGKEPGKDISIVGYDNYWPDSPLRAYESFIPEATVDKLNLQLGHELMDLLLARSRGELPAEPQQRLVKPELRIISERQSASV